MNAQPIGVEFVVTLGPAEADLHIDDLEALTDLEVLLAPGPHGRSQPVTLDLRPSRPPRFTLGMVVQALTEHRAEAGPGVPRVRCLVRSEEVVSQLGRALPATHRPSGYYQVGRLRVELRVGDITAVLADAVVNASNTRLQLGSGVSAALRRACGPGLQAEMLQHAPLSPGGLAVTGAHALPTAHTIVHVATASGGPEVVARALEAVLACCDRRGLRRVAVPALGMGTGGLSAEVGARVFAAALAAHGARPPCAGGLETVRVVLWTAADHVAFQGAFDEHPDFLSSPP